VDTN
jgi:hypothetical protein